MSTTRRKWRPIPLIANPWLRWGLTLGFLIYLALAFGTLEINWNRVQRGVERSARLFGDFLRPDFTTRWRDIAQGLIESVTMTVVSTAVGVVLAVPVAFGAARNVAPLPIYVLCRGLIILFRTFHEVIIALFFVILIGLGPLAGVLALIVASIGFLGKLLAEDIEDIDETQLEAMRATGASWLQTMIYGVVPQVLPRLIGLSVYRLDINFRESSVIGVAGAGGIGVVLSVAFQRYDFSSASAVLIIIIAIVLLAEYGSGLIRKRIQ